MRRVGTHQGIINIEVGEEVVLYVLVSKSIVGASGRESKSFDCVSITVWRGMSLAHWAFCLFWVPTGILPRMRRRILTSTPTSRPGTDVGIDGTAYQRNGMCFC